MTNQQIAIAIGYTVFQIGGSPDYKLIRPDGIPVWNKDERDWFDSEEAAWNGRDFLNDDTAAFEIDDWLVNEKQVQQTVLYADPKTTIPAYRLEVWLYGGDIISGDGPTRSAAIVAAFDELRKGEKK